MLAGLVEGLARSGKSTRSLAVGGLLDRARRVAESESEPIEARTQAVRLLARLRPEVAADLIPALLDPARPPAVQSVAARSIADVGSPALASKILGRWAGLGLATRREVLAAVLASPRWLRR